MLKHWIQYHSGLDDLGRRRFTLYWLTEGNLPGTESTWSTRGTRRAQEFNASPPPSASAEVVTRAPWE